MMNKMKLLIAPLGLLSIVSSPAVAQGGPLSPGWQHSGGVYTAKQGASSQPLDAVYEDFEMRFEMLCADGCAGGVLLDSVDRQDTLFLIDLADGAREAVAASRDQSGRVMAGEKLQSGPSPFAAGISMPRYGARPQPAPPPPAGQARSTANPQMPTAADTRKTPDGWHSVLVKRRNGVLSVRIDGKSIAPMGWLVPETAGMVRINLKAASGKQVQYRNLDLRNLTIEAAMPAEYTAPGFERLQLGDLFLTEAVSSGDINRDGVPDVIAGPNVWFGPDYSRVLHIYPNRPTGPGAYANSMFSFVADFTGDGWDDILEIGLPRQAGTLFVNPAGEARTWVRHEVLPSVATEIAELGDVDGDGKLEIVFGRPVSEGFGIEIGYAKPDPANPAGPWPFTPISSIGNWAAHGIGIGDIDGDGRLDVVNGAGWWSAPERPGEPWKEHKADLGSGATMLVDDVDGDGTADIVTSLDAHGYGLAWFKGARDAKGELAFTKQIIMGDEQEPVAPVLFSELHAVAYKDIDGDGLKDIVTGKRWWSHLDSELDPDPNGPPVLYWFQQVRDTKGTHFVPHMLHNRSGVGAQLVVEDLDGDGRLDIATSSRRGTFVFRNREPNGNQ